MNTIPAQEIKRRGISAVDELLEKGPVHVISQNRPRYVVMEEERYQAMREAEEERSLDRWAEIQRDIAEGDVTVLRSPEDVDAFFDALDLDADE